MICLILLFVISFTVDSTHAQKWNPDETADFPYGDLIDVPDRIEYWPDGLVYYNFNSSTVSVDVRKLVWSAMEEFHKYTCIRFEENEILSESIIFTLQEKNSCYSNLGKKHGGSNIVLGPNCLTKGIIIHQLMHSLGFYHENNRYDRDMYVRVNLKFVRPDSIKAFETNPKNEIDNIETYDLDSITHFSRHAFARAESHPTLTVLKNSNYPVGQRQRLSEGDINKINRRYNCVDLIPSTTSTSTVTTITSTTTSSTSTVTSTAILQPTTMRADIIELCKGQDPNTYLPHPDGCDKFISCSAVDHILIMVCPNKYLCFDPVKQQCDWPKISNLIQYKKYFKFSL